MRSSIHKFAGLLCLSAGLVALAVPAGADEPSAPSVRIGLPATLFRDVPDSLVQLLMEPFSTLMREQTGLDGSLVVVANPVDLGRQLSEDKLQLGVFHGVEFAWAQEKYPDLRPLCIAINRHRELYAYLVVRDDTEAAGFADLKGKILAMPKRTREHCHLYLQRWCAEQGVEPASYFGRVANHPSIQSALDDILRGKVQGAVVDGVTLEAYQTVKPGCHARLKVLQKSETFPAAVIAYHQGAIPQSILTQFRNGMVNANRNERSRILMELWSLTGFEAVPGNYAQVLQNILKAYPAPGSQTARAGVAPSVAP